MSKLLTSSVCVSFSGMILNKNNSKADFKIVDCWLSATLHILSSPLLVHHHSKVTQL